jgi:hypothetical protein
MWAAKDGAPTFVLGMNVRVKARSPTVWRRTEINGRVGHSECHTSRAKKLRYMSKIAAIFVRADNTHLMCTQPIPNLLMACL